MSRPKSMPIDTVVLQLHSGQFRLRDKNRFNEAKSHSAQGYSANSKLAREYARSWRKRGVYCPLVELKTSKQGLKEPKTTLEMQASYPKMVHGTNLFDADRSDLPTFWERTLFFFGDLGVDTAVSELEVAIVRRADFSKIIKLPDYLGRADEVVRILRQFDCKPESEFRDKEYDNGKKGISAQFYNTTQGYTAYDKLSHILVDGYTAQELNIKQLYEQNLIKRDSLRFELALNRKDSFEALVRRRVKTGKKKDFHLSEILDEDLSKGILCDVFEKVYSDTTVGLVTLSQMEEHELFARLERSEMSQAKQQQLYYWVRMATKFGIAGTWEQMERKYRGGSVGRLKGEVALMLQELGKISGDTPNLIEFIRSEHRKFEMVKPPPQLLNYFSTATKPHEPKKQPPKVDGGSRQTAKKAENDRLF